MSVVEYQARLATALQTPDKMTISMWENAQGELQFPAPSPVFQMGNMDLAGRLRPFATNAAGEITEENSAAIETLNIGMEAHLVRLRNMAYEQQGPSIGPRTILEDDLVNRMKRFGFANITLAGGVLANVPLVPALAGYHSVIQPYAIWSDTADHYTFAFEDQDDVDCFPILANIISVETKTANEIGPFATTHGVAGDNSGSPPVFPFWHCQTANLGLECDVAGGAGAEDVVLFYKYWYEVLP